jgi:hypothetical protein
MVDRSGRSRDGFLRLNTIYNMRLSSDLVMLRSSRFAVRPRGILRRLRADN